MDFGKILGLAEKGLSLSAIKLLKDNDLTKMPNEALTLFASLAFEIGDYNIIRKILTQLRNQDRKQFENNNQIDVLNISGYQEIIFGDLTAAGKIIGEIEHTLKSEVNSKNQNEVTKIQHSRYYTLKALYKWISADFADSIRWYTLAFDGFTAQKCFRDALKAEIGIADAHRLSGDYDKSIELYEAAKVKVAPGDLYLHGVIDHGLGTSFQYKSNYKRAIKLHGQAKKYFESLGNLAKKAITSTQLGVDFWRTGEYDLAIEVFDEAIEFQRDFKNTLMLADLLNNLGLIYYFKGEYGTARKQFKECFELRKVQGNKYATAMVLNNLGMCYGIEGELNKSLDYFTLSLDYKKQVGNQNLIVSSLINIGILYQYMGEIDLSTEYLNEAKTILTELQDQKLMALLLSKLGMVSFDQGDFDQGIKLKLESLDLLRDAGSYSDKIAVISTLIVLVLQNGLDYNLERIIQEALEIKKCYPEDKMVKEMYLMAEIQQLKTQGVPNSELISELNRYDRVEGFQYQTNLYVKLNLLAVHIDELALSHHPQYLRLIDNLFSELYRLIDEKKLNPVLIEMYILHSKFHLIQFQLNEAKDKLELSAIVAKEKKLFKLLSAIDLEKEKLKDLLKEWSDLYIQNPGIAVLIGESGIKEYMDDVMIHKSGYWTSGNY